jgi:capsular polysaccharide export protein
VPIVELFPHVDDVHCLTSLAGFEALLRGLPVTCHGLPFYAGWGLTRDLHASPRRTRRLALDELVAGALILYPTYVSRTTGHFTTPERALAELVAWRTAERDRRPSLIRPLLRPFLFHGRQICRTLGQSWQPAEGLSKTEPHDGR